MSVWTQMQGAAREVITALTDEELEGYEVTTDANKLSAILAAGSVAVMVNPPTVTFHTYAHHTTAYDVWIIAPTPTSPEEGWQMLAPYVEAIALSLSAETAEPEAFTDNQHGAYPAYVVKISD